MVLPDAGRGRMDSRLHRRLSRWETFVGPRSWSSRVVRDGLKFPLVRAPPRRRCRREVTDEAQRAVLRREVAEMLACGAISKCGRAAVRFESLLFCVGKRDGGWRPCLDLRPLLDGATHPTLLWDAFGVRMRLMARTISHAPSILQSFNRSSIMKL